MSDAFAARLSIYNCPAMSIPVAKMSVTIALAHCEISSMAPSLLPFIGVTNSRAIREVPAMHRTSLV